MPTNLQSSGKKSGFLLDQVFLFYYSKIICVACYEKEITERDRTTSVLKLVQQRTGYTKEVKNQMEGITWYCWTSIIITGKIDVTEGATLRPGNVYWSTIYILWL